MIRTILIAVLEKDTVGIYTTDYIPLSSKQYQIKVIDPVLGICTATDTIPEKVLIDEATFFIPAGFDEYGIPYYESAIKFNCKPF